MQVTAHTRSQLRLQTLLFVLLFLIVVGLLGWLSSRYTIRADWTANGSNSLSAASETLLKRIDGPLHATLYATDSALLRQPVTELMARYQRTKPDLTLDIINPQKDPAHTRELGISSDGELMLAWQGRSELLKYQDISEHGVTNALQRLSRGDDRYLVFLHGHGERDPLGEANHDLKDWADKLQAKGLKVQDLTLSSTGIIPDNTAVLVIASPRVELLPGEVRMIIDYVKQGGNLLWLLEPEGSRGLQPLADTLGIQLPGGTIIDMAAADMLGPDGALYALGTDYGLHPISEQLQNITLYPEATALEVKPPSGWDSVTLLRSTKDSWLEHGALSGEVSYDKDSEQHGPLTIATALWRQLDDSDGDGDGHGDNDNDNDNDNADDSPQTSMLRNQRIVVVGDGDFLSNSFVGNGGNLEMGNNIINWLSHDDRLIDIPVRLASDVRLQFSRFGIAVIGLVFLIVMPLLLVATGALVWWRRRRA